MRSAAKLSRRLRAAAPLLPQLADAGLSFYGRVVSYLAGEAGLRQFIDVSLGMRTSSVAHETAEAAAPSCRVVYVAGNPVVLTHARALFRSWAEGAVSYVTADAGDSAAILAGPARPWTLAARSRSS